VALGRTDRQIGAELFISHRTVERHVSNILAKFDAHTRAEIAAIAHRDGLVPVDDALQVRGHPGRLPGGSSADTTLHRDFGP
jgi:Bacterial regulatory proteins, luxR family